MLAAQSHVQSGCRVVVDVDLEKFFDRVNHDILIDRLQKRIADTGVIRLIRALFEQRDHGRRRWSSSGTRGTPQGGPLSPLLANVLPDEVDGRWNVGAIASCATPTMRTCTFVAAGRVNG